MHNSRKVEYEFFFKAVEPPVIVGFAMHYEVEDDQWVGVCLDLGTATYDRDLRTVRRELGELVVHALNSLEADGEREGFFEKHGIEELEVPQNLIAQVRETLLGEPLPPLPYWIPQHTHAIDMGEFAAVGA